MEFIPFEIANRLNDIGYPQYNSYKSYFIGDDDKRYVEMGSLINRSKRAEDFHLIAAPTISQVMKWLRDTHNIHINVGFVRFNGNTEIYWVFSVENIKEDIEYDWLYSTSHDSYEEAAMAGIEWVLDNILNLK